MGYTPGQVIGGRWKPLHHIMERILYRDQGASCGSDGRCFVRHDGPLAGFTGALTTSLLHVVTGAVTALGPAFAVNLGPGAAAMDWTCLGGPAMGDPYAQNCTALATVISTADSCKADGSDCLLLLNVTDAAAGNRVVLSSWELLTTPAQMSLDATASVTAAVGADLRPTPDGLAVSVTVRADKTALLVTLTTLAQGRFSDNVLMLAAGSSTALDFVFFGDADLGLLSSTLRVESANRYASGA